MLLSSNGWSAPGLQNPSPDTSKAEAAARAGQYYVAADEYQKLVKLQPRSAELWSNLGAVLALGGNCPSALPALAKARELNSSLFAPWYFSGVCHFRVHEDRQALGELQHAVGLNPRDANAWYSIAQAAGNLGQLGTAFDAATRVLDLDSKRPEAYYTAGKTALDLAMGCYARLHPGPQADPYIQRLEGERDMAQGVWVPAVAALRKALQLEPHAPDLHYALGITHQASGNFSEAETEFRECLKILPDSTLARLALARILAREQKTEEATKFFESVSLRGLQAKEEFEEYLSCAEVLHKTPAMATAQRLAAARFPGDASVAPPFRAADAGLKPGATADSPSLDAVALGVRYALISEPASGNFVAATFASPSQYREFRNAFLRDDVVRLSRLLAARGLQLPAEPRQAYVLGEFFQWVAFRFYDTLGRKFPDSEPAQMVAAENLSAAGEQDKALEIYQAMVERNGPTVPVLRAMAQVYWTQRRWDEALKVLTDLAQKDPQDATLYVNLGRIYSYRADWPNARRNFERAAEIDAGLFEAHLGLGEILRREGNEAGALRELLAAVRADPQNPRPHYVLSQIYRKQDKKELAKQEMETFQRLEAAAPAQRARKERLLVPVD